MPGKAFMLVVMAVRKTLGEGDQIVLLHSLIHQRPLYLLCVWTLRGVFQQYFAKYFIRGALCSAFFFFFKKGGCVCFSDGGIAIFIFPRSPTTATFSLHE